MSFDWSKYSSPTNESSKESFDWSKYSNEEPKQPEKSYHEIEDVLRLSNEEFSKLPFEEKARISKLVGERAKQEAQSSQAKGILPGVISYAERKAKESGIVPDVQLASNHASTAGEIVGSFNPVSAFNAALKAGPAYAAKFLQDFPQVAQALVRSGITGIAAGGLQTAEEVGQSGEAPTVGDIAKNVAIFGGGHLASESIGAAASKLKQPKAIKPSIPIESPSPKISTEPEIATRSFESQYEIGEEAKRVLDELNTPLPSKSLVGRAKPGAIGEYTLERPKPLNSNIEQRPTRTMEVGNSVYPERYQSDIQGGKLLDTEVNQIAALEYESVNQLYNESEKLNQSVSTQRKPLRDELIKIASEARQIKDRGSVTNQLIKSSENLAESLTRANPEGRFGGYLPLSNQSLINQVQEWNQLLDTEFAQAVPKNVYKRLIKVTTDSIEQAASQNPEALNSWKAAKKARANWGDKFQNETIEKFRRQGNEDYKALFETAQKELGRRRLNEVLSPYERGKQLMGALDREIAQKSLDPYISNPRRIITEPDAFDKVRANLVDTIGEEATERAIAPLKEYNRKVSSTPKNPEKVSKLAERGKFEPSKILDMTNEQIGAKATTRSGIEFIEKELGKSEKARKFIQDLKEQKAADLIFDGKLNPDETSKTLDKLLNDQESLSFLNYTLGSDKVNDLRVILKNKQNIENHRSNLEKIAHGIGHVLDGLIHPGRALTKLTRLGAKKLVTGDNLEKVAKALEKS